MYYTAQDVLDAYYQQEQFIEVDGEKVINPTFRTLYDLIEGYAIEKYEAGRESGYNDGQNNILENQY
jgi:hypothetical protein